jgi:hypothetical protein
MLPGDDTVGRAALLIAICSGVQLMRNVLRNSGLPDSAVSRLAPHLEAALDVIAYGTAAAAVPSPLDDRTSPATD